MNIPKDRFHIIIGSKGATMKSIKGNSKADINIPRESSINPNVVLTGTMGAIASAKMQIENAIAKDDARQEQWENGYGQDEWGDDGY